MRLIQDAPHWDGCAGRIKSRGLLLTTPFGSVGTGGADTMMAFCGVQGFLRGIERLDEGEHFRADRAVRNRLPVASRLAP
ncbi:hypothetical protein D0846_05470 [Bordetella avium]|nr:hypothetical protein D0848_04760 [Bordetella avium]RIQ45313.1 hypothetical protein D0846_05470 [Bordetella avium]RIQ51508.1 hypothetical protein D0845_03855 [Bordetella avium]RIQ54651.1 hypothetical protein D0843_03675 [Bordetella avium]RIQ57047.1 hypothetical protein D0844_01180 [Bordetella avium]